MHVSVHSLTKTHFDGDASSVNCRTLAGDVTILENHRPLISALGSGAMTIMAADGEAHYVNVAGGFLEVADNAVTCIIDAA
jgi:F-type H+-transporting ATPase subunit epsilon